MRLEPLGDSAYIVRDLPGPAYIFARFLNDHPVPGLQEAVASYETVGLYVDPDKFDPASVLKDWSHIPVVIEPRHHLIPVCYELGPDLEEVARLLDLPKGEVIAAHTSCPFQCFAIGFCPGFPYLGYLPNTISGVARLPSPRKRVEAGMVGITGRQTGIYPLERPGGWRLIGQTPLQLVDETDDYFPIEAGDTVRFVAISLDEFTNLKGGRLYP